MIHKTKPNQTKPGQTKLNIFDSIQFTANFNQLSWTNTFLCIIKILCFIVYRDRFTFLESFWRILVH